MVVHCCRQLDVLHNLIMSRLDLSICLIIPPFELLISRCPRCCQLKINTLHRLIKTLAQLKQLINKIPPAAPRCNTWQAIWQDVKNFFLVKNARITFILQCHNNNSACRLNIMETVLISKLNLQK